MSNNTILEIENLDLTLDNTEILKDFNFEVKAGKVFALIGPNGCGKSSLAYTLMGLHRYQPSQGKIKFKGEDITELATYERARRGLTLAWQEPARFAGVTVRKFLALSLKGLNKEVDLDQMKWALQKVAISPQKYLNRMVDETLSGGERKRIELASILLMEPDLVILDEPDSGVDVVALNSIGEVINYFRDNNTGVMLITHSEEILTLADRAALVCSGEIVKKGDPQEISKYFKTECTSCEDEDYREHLEVS